MASSLEGKTKEGVCGICSEELRDPIGLPCLHGFCFECLDDWYNLGTDKSLVVCPACKKPEKIPEGGLRVFPRLLLVTSSKKTGDMKEESKESEDLSCSICGKTAEVHCVDCKKSLCQPCHTSHDAFTKDHTIVTVKELQSGLVTDEGRICEIHGEQVRYYCETEQKQACPDCVSLHTCSIEHKRVTLKDAAHKQTSSFEDLVEKCAATKEKLQDAIKDIKKVQDDLTQSRNQALADLDCKRDNYIRQLELEINKQKDEIRKLEQGRVKEMESTLKALNMDVDKIEEACNEVSKLSQARSEYLTTHKYSSLSATLKSLSQIVPEKVDTNISHVETVSIDPRLFGHFEPDTKSVHVQTTKIDRPLREQLDTTRVHVQPAVSDLPVSVQSKNKSKWRYNRRFHPKGFNTLECVAINHDGDIAVGSLERGVKLFTKFEHEKGVIDRHYMGKGKLKGTDRLGVNDIAVTTDNRYIIAPVGGTCIQFHDSQGKHMYTSHVKNVHNITSNVNSVAVDATGRVVLGQAENTISIHYADGSLISRFATKAMPVNLAITSNNKIVCTFKHSKLQLMNFSGYKCKVIQPPTEVEIWSPYDVCCRQGEIFVVNDGDPIGIYRFTSEGEYLNCVTTDVSNPFCIELSKDGMELLVADRGGNQVKVFRRE